MRIKDNSVFPFILLVLVFYILLYVFMESLLNNGKPYMPFNKSYVINKDNSHSHPNSIDVLGSKDFLKHDSSNFFYRYIKNDWCKIEKGMDKKTVIMLVGNPRHIEKGLTEIWYYQNIHGNKGTIIFYEGKVINIKPPNY